MRRTTLALLVAVLLTGPVQAQSYIVYTLETGGNNHTADWEAFTNPMPGFTSGVTDGTTTVEPGRDLTWAIRVSTGGTHLNPGGAGDNTASLGCASLVFDLGVYTDAACTIPVAFGAAPMACATGVPNVGSPMVCKPTAAGFWSSINDGDLDGARPTGIDKWANAAFAIAIYNSATAPAQQRSLNDLAPTGPNFDYGWYPTANGRSGIPMTGGTPLTDITTASLNGKLIGFGAGYKSYEGTNYRPGVGKNKLNFSTYGFGANIGSDPQVPTTNERPLFEGQINTTGLPFGTYYIKVTPSQTGNNILHGSVNWQSLTPDYGGFGSFAVKANQTVMVSAPTIQSTGVPFVVYAGCVCPQIVARKLFYNNSWYDNNNAGIDAVTNGKCDSNAIDNGATLYGTVYPGKAPLMLGGGTATFANYSGYTKGINGLIYDVGFPTPRDPQVGDFTFHNIGKAGTTAPAPGNLVTPSGFSTVVLATNPYRIVRAVITFADNAVKETWLQVDVGTGFGPPAETHFWGNAAGDTTTVNNPNGNIIVNASDELAARSHPTNILTRSVVADPFDINKNSLCDATDQLIIRSNNRTILNCVKLIVK